MRTKSLLTICFAFVLATISHTVSAQWVKQNIPTTEGTMYYLFGTDKNTMWTYTRDILPDTANVKKAEFLRTGDGGKTYKKGTLFANAADVFYHIQPRDGKNAHMVSADSHGDFTFQKTVDSGATWQMMSMQPHTFPDHVYFWDNNNGIFIADPDSIGVVIMYTTNGGNTYTRLPQTNYPRMRDSEFPIVGDFHVVGDVFFFWSIDNATGEWRIWRSLDRGRNWTAGGWFTTGTAANFTPRIAFTDANNGMLMQGIGNISENPLYTEDGGATWHQSGKMPSYTTWPIKNIPNTQTMLAFFQDTVSRMVYSALTNDLGRTWNSRKDIIPYKLDSTFVPFGFPSFVFTNLDIVDNNSAWARFSLRELHRYDSPTPIVPEKPDLDLTITADKDGLPLWNYVKFTLTIKNRGISKATNIKANWLPPYKRTDNGGEPFANVGAYSSKGNYNWWTGDWTLPELAAGESATATFHLFVVKNNANVTQTAQITACNESDLDSAPNNMSANTPKEDDETSFTSMRLTNLTEPVPNKDPSVLALKISPNPAKDKAFLAINDKTNASWSVEVVNSLGQVVFSKTEQQNGLLELNTQDYKNGLYLVHLTNGTEKKVEKLMVQH